MYAMKYELSYLIKKLANTTNININKKDNKFESSLERIVWAKDYVCFKKLLLNYEINV